ncbi:hypothetical protein P3T25_004749 [Paraburkholderia sp. GAS32]
MLRVPPTGNTEYGRAPGTRCTTDSASHSASYL